MAESIHRIVVATDFEASAGRALELAADIAQVCGAELVLVHTCEVPAFAYSDPLVAGGAYEIVDELKADAEKRLHGLAEGLRPRLGPVKTAAVQGPPAQGVVDFVRAIAADLVVVGTHGRKGLPRALLGSTAERLVRTSPVPVLVAHAPR